MKLEPPLVRPAGGRTSGAWTWGGEGGRSRTEAKSWMPTVHSTVTQPNKSLQVFHTEEFNLGNGLREK